MAYCPECRREYPEGVVLCRDCGAHLGDSPPEADRLVRLVWLASVSGLVEGSMLVGALESQGLHPRLVHHALPAHGQVLRDWSTGDWGDLRVPEDELDEARLVLDDFREAVRRMVPLSADEISPGGETPPSDGAGGTGDERAAAYLRLAAVEPGAGTEPPGREDSGEEEMPVALVPLCGVSDVAEGKMLEGALRSQGLHPVLALSPAAPLASGLGGKGEIRVPAHELLESTAVLEDFRRALGRTREEPNPPGGASQD